MSKHSDLTLTQLSENVGYGRVSTREQAENSAALDQQLSRLENSGCSTILFDVVSGRQAARRDLNLLTQGIKEGIVKRVTVTRLARLSRSLVQLRTLRDLFEKHNVTFIILDESIDTSTASGKLQFNLMAAIAENYSDELSERIQKGKEYFRKQRRASHPVFGYTVVDFRHELDHELLPCGLSKKDFALYLIRSYLEKKSLQKVLSDCNDKYGWCPFANSGSFSRWLKNPVLQGDLVYFYKSKNPQVIRDTHDPLISRDTANQIFEQIAHNTRARGWGAVKSARRPLSGLIRCADCGGGCIVNTGGAQHRYTYYQCHNARYNKCDNHRGTRADFIEEALIKALCEKAEVLSRRVANNLNTNIKSEPPEVANLLNQLRALEALPFNEAIEQAKVSIQEQISNLRLEQDTPTRISSETMDALIVAGQDPKFWANLSDPTKRQFYHNLVNRIVVRGQDVFDISLKL